MKKYFSLKINSWVFKKKFTVVQIYKVINIDDITQINQCLIISYK